MVTSTTARPFPRAALRVAAVVALHMLAAPALVLAAGVLPPDFAAAGRLLLVVAPTMAAAAVVGLLHARILRAMPVGSVWWMSLFLAAASPFLTALVAFLLLMVAVVASVGLVPDHGLEWTLFALPLGLLQVPWSYVAAGLVLGLGAAAAMRPLAQPGAEPG